MDILELKKRLDELTHRVAFLENKDNREKDSVLPRVVKKVSPSEFLVANRPNDDVHGTFLLCYYAEHFAQMTSFNTQDIEQLFRSARMPVPKNLNDKINKNIKKGYITEAAEKKDGKKAWVITMSGDEAFNNQTKK